MNTTLLLTGLLLLVPAAYTVPDAIDAVDAMGAVEAECSGTPCDQINFVCEKVGGNRCLSRAAEPVDCAASVCTEVNERVCQPYFGTDCVYAPESRCNAEPCEIVNNVCERHLGTECLGMADAAEAQRASCTGNWVCDTANKACGNCLPAARL